jgi:predicted ester cyclase
MSEFLHGFADRWLAAWNSHDTGQVFALLHDDIVWDDRVFWPEVIHGLDSMRPYMDKIWSAMPDVAWTETERFFNPDHTRGLVLFEQTGSAPPGLGVEGRFRSPGCDIFLEFRDGKLAHYLGAYDIVGMLEQMGALPPRGARTGSGYVMSLGRR